MIINKNVNKKNKLKLTIVIPSRNEEENIIETLKQIKKEVSVPHQIIVVDDSSDNTQKLVKSYAKKSKNVSLIAGKSRSISFAKAIELGYKKAKTGVIVVVMADLCDDPKTINKMYKKIESGWDVVCGSRYVKGGSKKGGPKLQSVLSLIVCKSIQVLTGVPTSDVSNAFKMYKTNTLRNIRFNPISGVEASMETLLQIYFQDYKITEIPTTWTGRVMGVSKFRIFKRFPKYFRIWRWAIENSFRKNLGLNIKRFYI